MKVFTDDAKARVVDMDYFLSPKSRRLEMDAEAEKMIQVWFVVDSNSGEQMSRDFVSYSDAARALTRYMRTHRTDDARVVCDFQ